MVGDFLTQTSILFLKTVETQDDVFQQSLKRFFHD